MIVQKLHWNGQPRPGVEAREVGHVARAPTTRGRNGVTVAPELGQVVHVVVERLQLPSIASRSTVSMRPSASPANIEMPRSRPRRRPRGSSGSIEMHPLTWKPPMATGTSGGAELPRDVDRARELV